MSTLETSTASFANKVKAVALLPGMTSDREWLKAFVAVWDISVPLAMSVHLEYVNELSDKGVEEIERCFTALAETLGLTEDELLSSLE